MVHIFLNYLKKKWKGGIIAPISLGLFIPLIAVIWPEMRKASEVFTTILESPIYQAMLGELGLIDISQWSGAFQMYIFLILEYFLLFTTIFVTTKIITSEIDKKTLDVMLSYPIPRWRFLLEKFGGYLFYCLLYPLVIMLFTFASTKYVQYNNAHLNVEIDYIALTYALIGTWMLFFSLGALALLCSVILLDSRKAVVGSAAVIFGMYLLNRIGGMTESVEFIKYFSVFNYMDPNSIMSSGTFPVGDFFILLGVGLAALVVALIIFQKRELKY
ncbi:MAG: ABC transporter permease subunit [Candidatus Heimdallarchaeota archaeon]|nr:ABC transporter permease subunit [Candidatus Heimdallarchaeota archaeon]